jgi:hypothetical protein
VPPIKTPVQLARMPPICSNVRFNKSPKPNTANIGNVPFTTPPFSARRKFSELIIDWRLEQDYYGRHVQRLMMA